MEAMFERQRWRRTHSSARSPRPDAIYSTLDRFALGALREAQARSIPVPDELLIAGLSDSEAARHAQPPLATLDLHPDKIGQQAVTMLIALVEGRSAPQRHRLVSTQLILRASTARVPSGGAIALPERLV